MKRKLILIIILILIIEISLIIIYPKNQKDKFITKNEINDNSISIMLQDENGSYQKSNLNEFKQEGYRFNAKRSKCLNGSKIKYEENNIIVKTTKSDKCYAYFDNNIFVEDLSGNGNHGKNIGSIWQNDGLITGDETNFYGYVDCGLANYDFGSTISLIIRLKVNKITNYNGMTLRNNVDGKGVGFSITGANTFTGEIAIDTPRNDSWIGNSEYTLNEWYTLVETFDGHYQKIYTNGKLIAEKSLIGNIIVSKYPFIIGGCPIDVNGTTISYESYSTVSSILIFDRALTAEEIAQDYAENINPTNKDNLLLWYKFN